MKLLKNNELLEYVVRLNDIEMFIEQSYEYSYLDEELLIELTQIQKQLIDFTKNKRIYDLGLHIVNS